MRTVIAAITEPTGKPREGLSVWFYAPDDLPDVIVEADAAGVIRPELEIGVTYRVPVENAVIVDGVPFPAGTVILVEVSEGDGPAQAAEVLAGTIDASRPALLDMIAELQARVDRLQSTVADAGQAAGEALARAAGEVTD